MNGLRSFSPALLLCTTLRSFLCTVLYFLCAFSAKMATYSLVIALHEKKNFRLTKIWKRTEKIIFSLVFVSFHGKIIFSGLLFFKRKCKKAASFHKCIFCVNIKFSYMIDGCKDEIFCIVL